MKQFISIALLLLFSVACTVEPQTFEVTRLVDVEMTRQEVEVHEVEVTRELEVTRLVTREVEVTRFVQEENPLLDYRPIAGQWSGQGTEAGGIRFFINVILSEVAEQGSQIGTEHYSISGSDEFDCEGFWLALSAENPVYSLREQISGECSPGTVDLEYDPESGTLRYEYSPSDGNPLTSATGELERSD